MNDDQSARLEAAREHDRARGIETAGDAFAGAIDRIVHELHTRYYAVPLSTLERLLQEAGFGSVVRRDEHFFQPLLVERKSTGVHYSVKESVSSK